MYVQSDKRGVKRRGNLVSAFKEIREERKSGKIRGNQGQAEEIKN